eukprot:g27959.t1
MVSSWPRDALTVRENLFEARTPTSQFSHARRCNSTPARGRTPGPIAASLRVQKEKLRELEKRLRCPRVEPLEDVYDRGREMVLGRPGRGITRWAGNRALVRLLPLLGLVQCWEIKIPDFVDCTGPTQSDWQPLRWLFSQLGRPDRFPTFQEDLLDEAHRLKWYVSLPVGTEDYPGGAAAFYHSCHFGEPTEYCLYGHLAALTYLAKHLADVQYRAAWGFTILSLWDIVENFAYPQVSILHQFLEWGHDVAHQNFVKPYEGRAEAFIHPFPQSCSPNCPHQQESVPYSFPIFMDMEQSKQDFHAWMLGNYLNKPEISRSSIFLCTNPIYYCNFFVGLNKTILGYFGLPLLYMVPHKDWSRWLDDFIELAALPSSLFVSNNPLHSAQVDWQSGVRLPVLRPVALYITERFRPERLQEVLVPEPREACVLYCMLRAFTPEEGGDGAGSAAHEVSARLCTHDLLRVLCHGNASLHAFAHRPPFSPLSLTSSAALHFWRPQIDFFALPAVQLFGSLAELLVLLPEADLMAISRKMQENRKARLESGAAFWHSVAKAAARDRQPM